jgi:hypothetical protein
MAEKMEQWTMRYRTGVAGVKMGTIVATASCAEAVAKWQCNKDPNHKFVGLERAVLATQEEWESAMSGGKVAVPPGLGK